MRDFGVLNTISIFARESRDLRLNLQHWSIREYNNTYAHRYLRIIVLRLLLCYQKSILEQKPRWCLLFCNTNSNASSTNKLWNIQFIVKSLFSIFLFVCLCAKWQSEWTWMRWQSHCAQRLAHSLLDSQSALKTQLINSTWRACAHESTQ